MYTVRYVDLVRGSVYLLIYTDIYIYLYISRAVGEVQLELLPGVEECRVEEALWCHHRVEEELNCQ
jgi:hypothetical protein